jgi:tetratricopeptide (TPR) repeat protein
LKGGHKLTVYGLGGCGKTAVVLEAVYEFRDHNPMCAVFWIAAVSRESIELSFKKIGVLLNIPGILDQENNAKQLVKARLSDETFGPWLLVVDNADDTSILSGSREGNQGAERLIDYLPSSRHGSVLFTTRTRLAAVELSGANSIALGRLTISEATDVLETHLLPEHRHELKNRKVTNQFLDMLACFALAIVQAIAFINKNDITLEDYMSYYRDSEQDAMDLLFEDQSQYGETENPIATTWYITFEQIRKLNQESVRLLSFITCMANNDIPETILPPSNGKLERAEAIGILKAYAFVTERTTGDGEQTEQAFQPTKMFDVHPLVHFAMRRWLKAHGQWSLYITEAMQRILSTLSCDDSKDIWMPCLLHASYFADIPEVHSQDDSIQILRLIGSCYFVLGKYFTCETYFQKAFERSERLLGRTDPCTQAQLIVTARILNLTGRFKEAESMLQEITALRKEIRGKEDPITLRALDALGEVLFMSKRYTEATEIQEELLALSKDTLGEMHPDTINRMGSLAQAYHANNMLQEARTIFNEQIQLSTQIFGEAHMTTMEIMTGLAGVLDKIGDHTEAECLYRKTLALRKNILGKEHPETLGIVFKLGLTLIHQKQFIEAERLLQEAALLTKNLEGNSESLENINYSLVLLYASQNRFSEVEELCRNILNQQRSLCRKDDEYTLLIAEWLAAAVGIQGRYEEAVSLSKYVYDGCKNLLGLEDQKTIRAMKLCIRFKRNLDRHSSPDKSNDPGDKNLRTAAQSDNKRRIPSTIQGRKKMKP